MMFSGTRHGPPPGFRIVDYEFEKEGERIKVTPDPAMSLCPQIVEDMATPFISKDGRYVAAHDNGKSGQAGSLKIFEITAVHPERRTTTCEERVDFGFAAGKADFSFDGSQLTSHISKHDYLTPFIDGGIKAPAITDVVVVSLTRGASGDINGYQGVARVTTSTQEGVGSYFPAFFPDGKLFYIANTEPKQSSAPKRFLFKVVDPSREVFMANFFADPEARIAAETVGRLWRETCASEMAEFKAGEAAWLLMSLSENHCRALVERHWTGTSPTRADLVAACRRSTRVDPTAQRGR
jgi:hypothetical protein